jgi:hypothetical protein
MIPGETRSAVAFVRSHRVSADSIVAEVFVDCALVNVVRAGQASPAGGATAVEAVGSVDAGGAVLTGTEKVKKQKHFKLSLKAKPKNFGVLII